MQKSFRKAMLSTICMLIVAVLSLTGVTYAWFSAATTATVSGMTMNIGAAGAGLQVKGTADTDIWGSELKFNYTGQAGTAEEPKMLPVSTVDAENFFTATVDVNDPKIVLSSVADTSEKNIWVKEFKMRNTGTGDIVVKLNAAVFSDNEANTNGNSAYEAARIAVFQVTPNGLVTVGGVPSGATKGLKFIYGATEHYLGIKGAGSDFDMTDDTKTDVLGVVNSYQSNYNNCEFVVPGMTDANEQQEATYKVVVWFEGQDPECKNSNALSAFDVNLSFEVK